MSLHHQVAVARINRQIGCPLDSLGDVGGRSLHDKSAVDVRAAGGAHGINKRLRISSDGLIRCSVKFLAAVHLVHTHLI